MNNKELVVQRLRDAGYEEGLINDFIVDFGNDNLNEPIYLLDFEGKKALIPESYLVEVNDLHGILLMICYRQGYLLLCKKRNRFRI